MLLVESRGVGSLGVIGSVTGLLLEVGLELLKAGIAFGTAAYAHEMQKQIMKLTTQQQVIVMQKEAEIAMLLEAQAQEFRVANAAQEHEYYQENAEQVINATVGTSGTLAMWGVGALALVLILKKRR